MFSFSGLGPSRLVLLLAAPFFLSPSVSHGQTTSSAGDKTTLEVPIRETSLRAVYNTGLRYMQAHQYQKAVDAFTRVLTLKPADQEARRNRAIAYYNLGLVESVTLRTTSAFDKAAMDASILWKANLRNVDALLLRADAYYAARRDSEAAADYENYLTFKPGDEYASMQWVECLTGSRWYLLNIRKHSAALAVNPGDAPLYASRGRDYLKAKDYEAAIADFTRYLSLHGEDVPGYVNLAQAYFFMKDYLNAAITFEKAARLKPMDSASFLNAALSYKNHADSLLPNINKANPLYDKALALWDIVLGQNPTSAYDKAMGLEAKAVALEAKAKASNNDRTILQLALAAWEKWLPIAPSDPELPARKKHIEDLKAQAAREK